MRQAAAFCNSHNLYGLIENTGPWKLGASEVIRQSDGKLIHARERPLVHLEKHHREQFSCSIATMGFAHLPASESMQVNTNPLSKMEVGFTRGQPNPMDCRYFSSKIVTQC